MKVPAEFLPVVEWWEKDGKKTVVVVVAAAVAAAGWYGWKAHQEKVRSEASAAVINAFTSEELEEAVVKFSGTAAEGMLKLRLAKSYFGAGKFETALENYESLIGSAPDGFADVPVVGKAQCLEALGKFAEAAKEFDAFAEANPDSFLALTARLGAARSIAEGGDLKKALARLDSIKESLKDDQLGVARVEATVDCVKRFEKRAERSLVDAADAAAKQIEKEGAGKKAAPAAADKK